MPPTKSVQSDTDVTVTTATATEDEVREAFGEPAAPAAKPASGEPAAAATSAAKPEEVEADSHKPDAEVSDAARKLRSNRLSERLASLREDIGLYEDNIAGMGGTVAPFDKAKRYDNPQAEIDALSKRRNALVKDFNRVLKNPPRPAAPARPAPAAAATPAGGGAKPAAPAEPKFEFSTFEAWQEKNPDGDYTVYLDARQDARYQFNRQIESAQAERAASQRAESDAVRQFHTGADELRADFPDYDDVTTAVNLDAYIADGAGNQNPAFIAFKRAIVREGKNGPRINYYLAQHPDELHGLLTATSPADFLQTFGVIKHVAKTALVKPAPAAAAASAAEPAAAAPAARRAAPSKTPAPAPLEPVRGSSSVTRSLNDIAADDEDADEYIEKRRAAQRKSSGR